MRLPGGRQAQPGVATGQSVLAWRLGYAEVFHSHRSQLRPGLCQGLPALCAAAEQR